MPSALNANPFFLLLLPGKFIRFLVAFTLKTVFKDVTINFKGPKNRLDKLHTEKDLLDELLRSRKGLDERAKERFYKHYWGYLMGVALRYVGDKDLASIVVNDSYLKIFRNLHSFECADAENFHKVLKGWMAKITVRTALNELRKTNRQILHEELTEMNGNSAQVMMQDRLHKEHVRRLIGTLTPNLRNVFMLYEIEGFSHEEIGELLGISASSSRVYLVRAREKLKTLYLTLMA